MPGTATTRETHRPDGRVQTDDVDVVVVGARCARISDALFRQLIADARAVAQATAEAGPGGHAGRHMNPARPAHTRTPALRISHFPDPHRRRYPRRHRRGRPTPSGSSNPPLDDRVILRPLAGAARPG